MIKSFILATRPWSFIMTIISVTLGSVLALNHCSWDWLGYILALVGTLFIHAASNLLNDYFDTLNGVDAEADLVARDRPHPILTGIFTAGQILWISIVLYAFAVGIGIVLILYKGIPILIYMLAGTAGGVFYTAGPRYKYHALGEVFVFLLWGPVLVSATYYIQCASFISWLPVFWISLLQGAWVALVLFIDNLKDIDFDRNKGIWTMGILLGKKRGLRIFIFMIILIYLSTGLEILLKLLPVYSLFTLILLPLVILTGKKFFKEAVLPPDSAPRTANIGMLFGLLLVLSIIVSRVGL